MIHTNELKEIFSGLAKELIPGKTISAIEVVLKIMEKYRTEEAVEDLSVTVFIKKYYENREAFGKLIDDLIALESSYQSQPSKGPDDIVDPSLSGTLKRAEEEALRHPQSPIPIMSAIHILLGAMKEVPEIEDIFKKHGAGYDELIKVNDENKSIFNDINSFIANMLDKSFQGNNKFSTLILGKQDDDEKSDDNDYDLSFDPGEFMESIGFPLASGEQQPKGKSNSKTPMLDKYAKNLLTESLDPIYGRENELSQLLEILGCKKKNNAILIGEAGVGKTSVVELLAQKIQSQEVPKNFLDKKIYSLDLNALVAGTKYRGQYEERLQGIIEEVVSNKNIIVFIDEIHNLIGNGGSEGNGDAANILKPYLAKGKFQCIGSTTFKEYRKYIESDAALKRRFQTVIINEPTSEETKIILKNIKEVYEKHHNVVYPKEVINACVELSGRYLSSSRFPDKAIDALDLSGSLCRLVESKADTEDYLRLTRELESVKESKIAAIEAQNFEEAISLRDKEGVISKALETKTKPVKVTLESVYQAIGKRSGVPIDTIGSSDLDKLRKLNEILNKEVIGQEKAVREIVMNLQKNSLSIRDKSKPVSLLFTGPTGCGKTYLCKKLAQEFFGSSDALIRFDMGEFEEKHSISKLTGATASYVGYDDEPLFEKIRHQPYSVVLFDEIEKAAPEIFQIFLNILDEGYVTLGNGVRVDFRHCIIIFTGNIGTKELTLYGNGLGYGATKKGEKMDETRKDGIIQKAIEKTFAPEFINRLSKIVIFSNLGNQELIKIIDLELSKLSKRLKENKISLKVGKALKEHIISLCNLNFGARDLQRKISELIEEKICEKLLEPDIPEGKKTFGFDYKDGNVVIEVK